MLKLENVQFYQVKSGQGIEEIALAFSVSPWLLAKENRLTREPFAGQILKIPQEKGNLYIVREGDTKVLLCGSAENYAKKNGTDAFYLGMRVRI